MTAVTGQPAYRQVADDLRSKILGGVHPVGQSLPSTKQLMATYGVSSTVVRAAIGELRADGVVAGQPGKGVYVVKEPSAPGAVSESSVRTLESLERAVEELQQRVSRLEAERAANGKASTG
ncbi:regulatory protein, gntR family [Parafrankia irregularis]|uniref:Regulatory protein, gntR family n=1 Tax=Parafrankia irregularis TaxID=795642 RepID=A0A0S4QRB2_9ACTN|nr:MULTISPECIES: winged helix-turn-helix domain-containing protein [Parafrankia]MBE3202660.1 winged helix-turn-helix transcriptional regulator [Parafrankia sp. CH37]CUU57844.1 regulatory protein, gntR family [Parafrankia irregularis]